jgi:regulator of protease activity HflC (stomatin/prohibitin superfamily)
MIGGLIAAIQESVVADYYIAFIFPGVMLLLSAELLLNFILDLYRPRVPGQEHHPSYDSRLLNLVAEPGRVGHSIAETLNYQFGFEVSKTWFYQLLSRAFVPLLLFGVAVMIGMTSVVIVREGEQGVVLHWGKIDRVMDPGINFKWPWPIDRVTIFEVGKIHEILLGAGEELAPKEESKNARRRDIMLWTEEHGSRRELDFLIAVPPEARESLKFEGEEPPPPVSIIKLVVAMQYRITDVEKFGYRVKDAQKLLEDTAYREMVRYCATATLDSPLPGSTSEERPEAIMTYGRARAARELKKRIQTIADELDLGVEIVFLGLVSAHPPAAAAGAFEEVLEAERRIDEKRYQAEGIANQILVDVAGDPDLGLELAAAIRTLEQLRDMDQMKKSPAGLDLAVKNAIRSTKDSIAQLDIQVAQQKLLGQNLLGRQTAKDRLRESYVAYLDRLDAIDADQADYDYESAIAEYVKKVDTFFSQVAGRPAVLIAQAQADRWQKELTERGRYESFQRELLAYQASPQVYSFDRWMDVWDEVLPNTMKYVLGVERDRVEYWLNWELQKEAMEGAFENLDRK